MYFPLMRPFENRGPLRVIKITTNLFEILGGCLLTYYTTTLATAKNEKLIFTFFDQPYSDHPVYGDSDQYVNYPRDGKLCKNWWIF